MAYKKMTVKVINPWTKKTEEKVVKATISYADNTNRIERVVYINEAKQQFVKINGDFIWLGKYQTDAHFKFHGTWW